MTQDVPVRSPQLRLHGDIASLHTLSSPAPLRLVIPLADQASPNFERPRALLQVGGSACDTPADGPGNSIAIAWDCDACDRAALGPAAAWCRRATGACVTTAFPTNRLEPACAAGDCDGGGARAAHGHLHSLRWEVLAALLQAAVVMTEARGSLLAMAPVTLRQPCMPRCRGPPLALPGDPPTHPLHRPLRGAFGARAAESADTGEADSAGATRWSHLPCIAPNCWRLLLLCVRASPTAVVSSLACRRQSDLLAPGLVCWACLIPPRSHPPPSGCGQHQAPFVAGGVQPHCALPRGAGGRGGTARKDGWETLACRLWPCGWLAVCYMQHCTCSCLVMNSPKHHAARHANLF